LSEPRGLAVSPERKKELAAFCKNAAIKFKNLALLNLAFTHRSLANEFPPVSSADGSEVPRPDNERLEFLGDAVLGVVTATVLYRDYGEKVEGELAKIKSVVVSEDILCGIARELEVDRLILLGRGEERSGGRAKNAILADAMEALFGALYLDGGYKTVFAFVERCITPEIRRVVERGYHRDYKSLLQELSQHHWKTYPLYQCTRRDGPGHEQIFWVEVRVNQKVYGPCPGKNKKTAEQEAARRAWEDFSKEPPAPG
jgi:ribonuclease-3